MLSPVGFDQRIANSFVNSVVDSLARPCPIFTGDFVPYDGIENADHSENECKWR